MTKTLFKAALAATVATGLFATPAMAANSDTKPFTATARIVKPLTLTKNIDLDFGTITMDPTLVSATVVVSQAGVRTCGTDLTCSGAVTAAEFDVAGVANQVLDVAVQPIAILTDVVSGDTLPFSASAPATITLDANGDDTFNIGGTVTVAAGKSEGTYSSLINVTVSYQ